jgi:O-antigen/teichoic acid export membrane protein
LTPKFASIKSEPLSGIKKLAGQTLWYGGSSIAARFLSYLLTPYLTATLTGEAYGDMSMVYALIPFLNIIFTYGLETAFFRFAKSKEEQLAVYNTATVSLIVTTIAFTALLILFNDQFAALIGIKNHPEYFTWCALIIAFDSLCALAFAKLRLDERPIKFALVRVSGIIVYIASVFFFLSVCPAIQRDDPNSFIGAFYDKDNAVGYVIIANLIQAIVTFLLLFKEFFSFRWQFDAALWKRIIIYSAPLILAGFAGMINETLDRFMLRWWTSAPTEAAAKIEVGTYSACYKLSILITLFIQAFRMGAEPFFFKQASGNQPQKVYARVMKFFVITISVMFLVVALFLDIWKHFIQNPVFWEGLGVVPVLLLANMFLGIYYNLSIWYKLSNQTIAGAWITLIGAFITLLINFIFIPWYGYMACAWATFFCYGTMMVVSYVWGQKAYPVPYPWKKLIAYIIISVLIYLAYRGIELFDFNTWINMGLAVILLFLFIAFIVRIERNEFRRLPMIGRFF